MKKIIIFLLLITSVFFGALRVDARSILPYPDASTLRAYRFYKEIDNISISVPTVVEVPFAAESIGRFNFAVFDRTTNSFEPYFFKQETLVNEIPISVTANLSIYDRNNLQDDNPNTYANFPLPDSRQGIAQITLSTERPVTSSAVTTLLDGNVALPNFIEIRALVDGQDRIVLASRSMDGETIRFPQTTSNRWTITFTFGQPLRISELRLHQDNATKTSQRAVRFLAQPSHSYAVYFDPDRLVIVSVGEAGNLASANDVLVVTTALSQSNPAYIIADADSDRIPDITDNCVLIANSDQLDVNKNGSGDVCDDFDQDGIINNKDNCPDNPNRDQKDTDNDRIGDVCDKEESRITERYTWLPWAGIGFAATVLIVLLVLTAKSNRTPA